MIGGRLFGVTIPGRYDATDEINNPIMALEYIKRNQNWSDNDGTPLIKTSGNGSFDAPALDELKSLTIARQISDESEQWTDALAKSLCEAFYLVSRQDENGYECVHYLMDDTVALDEITIADIIPGSLGVIVEPKVENIFVEPYVNYGYDYATEKFTQHLRVGGVENNASWSADLTPGFNGTDGEAIWNACRVNYLKYGRIEKLPESISDQYWIVDYDTALWKIGKIVDWQANKRFSFSVPYMVGRNFYCGKVINIAFPNETNNDSVRSVINRLTRNKNQNKISIAVTILEDISSEYYSMLYQSTDGAALTWQETDGAAERYQEV